MPPQEILTKDSVTVSIDAVVYYKIGKLYALKSKDQFIKNCLANYYSFSSDTNVRYLQCE